MNTLIEYLAFIGSGLYLISAGIFFFLFIRTCRTKDGVGLLFLRYLTLAIAIGSFVIFVIRILSEQKIIDMMTARAIAIVNPLLLVTIALYLNYLFKLKAPKKPPCSEDITTIRQDIKETNKNVKMIKDEVVK